MGALVSRGAEGIKDMGDGGAGRAGDVQKDQESRKPPPPPPTVYFNPEKRTQVARDAYDSSLQQSRFQFQSPEHF